MSNTQKNKRPVFSPETIGEANMKLIELIGRLQESIANKNSREHLGPALVELVNYTKNQFPREEKLMQGIDYLGIEGHRAQHNEFSKRLAHILIRLKQGKEITVYELISLLRKWVDDHVLIEDLTVSREIENGQNKQEAVA